VSCRPSLWWYESWRRWRLQRRQARSLRLRHRQPPPLHAQLLSCSTSRLHRSGTGSPLLQQTRRQLASTSPRGIGLAPDASCAAWRSSPTMLCATGPTDAALQAPCLRLPARTAWPASRLWPPQAIAGWMPCRAQAQVLLLCADHEGLAAHDTPALAPEPQAAARRQWPGFWQHRPRSPWMPVPVLSRNAVLGVGRCHSRYQHCLRRCHGQGRRAVAVAASAPTCDGSRRARQARKPVRVSHRGHVPCESGATVGLWAPLHVCCHVCMHARARSHRERTGAHAHVQLYRHEFVKPSCPLIVVPAFAEVADGAMKLGFLEHF